MDNFKKCTKCEKLKKKTEFSKDVSKSSGLHSHCKSCMNSYAKENSDAVKSAHKKWVSENREKVNAYQRNHASKNRLASREYARKWRAENKEKIDIYRIKAKLNKLAGVE